MTNSLVTQVDQCNRAAAQAVSDNATDNGTVLSYDEAVKFTAFQRGANVNHYVCEILKQSKVISAASNLSMPYCMSSQSDNPEVWNFSWGVDFSDGVSTRSCFFIIYPDGMAECREFPKETLQLNDMKTVFSVAMAVVSDVLQSHDWDKDETMNVIFNNLREQVGLPPIDVA
ncbi:hypothetical protein [Synechococcus sp. ROS8604]|uniref:hypothetical protein n=1 Tax=Synechococcus sp. ROS8604 TaxID=1442557 RepID=UPI00164666F3|nr:hypothetical protein [Synechococcus sp. ROS8604]QNI88847.1 hypothetical protein SynROS8604_02217 [Synechococcus sp. ROS8604]